jgi:hypothetical protein
VSLGGEVRHPYGMDVPTGADTAAFGHAAGHGGAAPAAGNTRALYAGSRSPRRQPWDEGGAGACGGHFFSCRGDETAGFFHLTPLGEEKQSLLHEGRRSSDANEDLHQGRSLDIQPQPATGAGAGADARPQGPNRSQGWREHAGVPGGSSGKRKVIPGTDSPRSAGPVPCTEYLEEREEVNGEGRRIHPEDQGARQSSIFIQVRRGPNEH